MHTRTQESRSLPSNAHPPPGDILESFDRHPPLILPSSSFQLELRNATVEPALFQQLRLLQAWLRRLPPREGGPGQVTGAAVFRKCVNIWY